MGVSSGQMNLASIIGGLTKGLASGLAFKRQHDKELAKQRGMVQYRQAQIGMEQRRMKMAEERAELLQEEAEYKRSIRESPEEVKKTRGLERKVLEKRIETTGVSPEPTEFAKTISIGNLLKGTIKNNNDEIKSLTDANMILTGQLTQATNMGNKDVAKVLENKIKVNDAQVLQLRQGSNAARIRLEKNISALDYLNKKASPEEKSAVKALDGKVVQGETINEEQAASLVMSIKSADNKTLNEIFNYLFQNRLIGPNARPGDRQIGIQLKILMDARKKELGGR